MKQVPVLVGIYFTLMAILSLFGFNRYQIDNAHDFFYLALLLNPIVLEVLIPLFPSTTMKWQQLIIFAGYSYAKYYTHYAVSVSLAHRFGMLVLYVLTLYVLKERLVTDEGHKRREKRVTFEERTGPQSPITLLEFLDESEEPGALYRRSSSGK